jgi:hypothetical protein
MWQNFFWACKLGTVLRAADTIIWQKRDRYAWVRMGQPGDYSASSIAWPARVLLEGIA